MYKIKTKVIETACNALSFAMQQVQVNMKSEARNQIMRVYFECKARGGSESVL